MRSDMVRQASVSARDEGGGAMRPCRLIVILAAWPILPVLSSCMGVVSSSFVTQCLDDRRPRFLMVCCDFVNLLTNSSQNPCVNVQHKLSEGQKKVEKESF